MEGILEHKSQNFSLADATYLRWYEMTNALSHAHTHAIFSRYQERLTRETRKTGTPELPTSTIIRCFREATQEVAKIHALRRFESSTEVEE